jgi:hypothetical protein
MSEQGNGIPFPVSSSFAITANGVVCRGFAHNRVLNWAGGCIPAYSWAKLVDRVRACELGGMSFHHWKWRASTSRGSSNRETKSGCRRPSRMSQQSRLSFTAPGFSEHESIAWTAMTAWPEALAILCDMGGSSSVGETEDGGPPHAQKHQLNARFVPCKWGLKLNLRQKIHV